MFFQSYLPPPPSFFFRRIARRLRSVLSPILAHVRETVRVEPRRRDEPGREGEATCSCGDRVDVVRPHRLRWQPTCPDSCTRICLHLRARLPPPPGRAAELRSARRYKLPCKLLYRPVPAPVPAPVLEDFSLGTLAGLTASCRSVRACRLAVQAQRARTPVPLFRYVVGTS